jgi:hypothetical protein
VLPRSALCFGCASALYAWWAMRAIRAGAACTCTCHRLGLRCWGLGVHQGPGKCCRQAPCVWEAALCSTTLAMSGQRIHAARQARNQAAIQRALAPWQTCPRWAGAAAARGAAGPAAAPAPPIPTTPLTSQASSAELEKIFEEAVKEVAAADAAEQANTVGTGAGGACTPACLCSLFSCTAAGEPRCCFCLHAPLTQQRRAIPHQPASTTRTAHARHLPPGPARLRVCWGPPGSPPLRAPPTPHPHRQRTSLTLSVAPAARRGSKLTRSWRTPRWLLQRRCWQRRRWTSSAPRR